jgi:hypothetical protein
LIDLWHPQGSKEDDQECIEQKELVHEDYHEEHEKVILALASIALAVEIDIIDHEDLVVVRFPDLKHHFSLYSKVKQSKASHRKP